MLSRTLAVSVLMVLSTVAFAQAPLEQFGSTAADMARCRSQADDKARLACYDSQADKLRRLVETIAEETVRKSAKRFDASEMMRLDATDVFVNAQRYLGKSIELRNMSCYFADDEDYRCIAGGSTFLAVFATGVAPAEVKSGFERSCSAMRNIATAACRYTVRLLVENVSRDIVSGAEQRIILKTSEVQLSKPPRR